ncbi:hypothetical protein MFIFM68171_05594 [Madurella fahalii]|uniref:Uncharacterized protein n=1 Tax=Madurella fahalii TaxID=1157608 RepID=A0ABQ0GC93_9PEZI
MEPITTTKTFYSLHANPEGKVAVVQIRNFPAGGDPNKPECYTHTIHLFPELFMANLRTTANGVTKFATINLLPGKLVLVDFLPKVFGSVVVIYALSISRTSLFIQPFSVHVQIDNKPVLYLDAGDSVFYGSCEMFSARGEEELELLVQDGRSGVSGVEIFREELQRMLRVPLGKDWALQQQVAVSV